MNEDQHKADTSDGTTAPKAADQIAEETVDQVKSSDQVAREADGRPDPEEGHDVRDYRPETRDNSLADDVRNPGHPDYVEQGQRAENVGDDAAVNEHGDDV